MGERGKNALERLYGMAYEQRLIPRLPSIDVY